MPIAKPRIPAILAVGSLVWLAAAPARAGFTIVPLGPPSGYNGTLGQAINASGAVAGDVVGPQGQYVAARFQGGTATAFGSLGGPSYGYAINDAGDVVGASAPSVGPGVQHGFFYDHATQAAVDLGTLGGSTSYAQGINNSNVIVGWSGTAGDSNAHAFAHYGGTMHDLGSYAPGGNSYAFAINQQGLIAGSAAIVANNVGYPEHAVTIDLGGHFTDLGTLGSGRLSIGFAINNSGVVAGYSTLTSDDFGTVHAFATLGGVMTDLGTLGGPSSGAAGINDFGDVVGFANLSNTENHAFLYRNGVMLDLNTMIDPGLGWVLFSASDINDAGQITGYGLLNGQIRGFVLDAGPSVVPEPSSLALSAGGLVVLALSARRRRA